MVPSNDIAFVYRPNIDLIGQQSVTKYILKLNRETLCRPGRSGKEKELR